MTDFAVIGIEHLHVFELVNGLLDAGAHDVAYAGDDGPLLDLYAGWRSDVPRRTPEEILDDPGVDLVVLAGVPSKRADTAVAALSAGKAVLSDKPGVTTVEQLEAVTAAAGRAGRPWWVLFSERFTNRAVIEAVHRARRSEIGRVVDVVGLGPHSLMADGRPEWFWDPGRSGGILVDIGSHQIDQFCAIVDPDVAHDITVTSASVGNVDCADHPQMQDVGRVTLAGAGAVGSHRVDYLTAEGLGTWGDVRLMITGTEGTLEVRANIDPTGTEGGEHLIQVDRTGTHRIDCSTVAVDWAARLLTDLENGTDEFLPAAHVHRVCRLTLEAQANATPWPT